MKLNKEEKRLIKHALSAQSGNIQAWIAAMSQKTYHKADGSVPTIDYIREVKQLLDTYDTLRSRFDK